MDIDHVFPQGVRTKANPRDVKKVALTNARLMALEHPETFHLPSDAAIKKVNPGDFVKVAIKNGDGAERFWTQVSGFEGRKWFGRIANDLVFQDLKRGDAIQFLKKNIYDVEYK